jgi:hypothetical protein
VRERLQRESGREHVAGEIRRLLDALARLGTAGVSMCAVSDEERHYLIFLDANTHDVLAVVTPPLHVEGNDED